MPRTKEITVTFAEAVTESVENIPRGQSIIIRDVVKGHDEEVIVRRWHFDGSSEELYKGPLEHEDWRGQRGL